MTPQEICDALNASRVEGVTGVWVPHVVDGADVYGCSENGVVGKGRWLSVDEATRLALRHRAETATAVGSNRPGFTLTEMLAVLFVVGVLGAVVAPVALNAVNGRRVASTVTMLHGEFASMPGRSAAAREPLGVRFYPSKTTPGAFDRYAPLVSAPRYRAGLASARSTFPARFAAPPRCLVLEEAKYKDGVRLEPTSWCWNVRVGDVVRFRGHDYTVAGPAKVTTTDLFVNADPHRPFVLDRGEGACEYLYLVNGLDDDRDGFTDDGHNGTDEDLDGEVDEPDEWEPERWATSIGDVVAEPYEIIRRPIADEKHMRDLPAGVVIDAGRSVMPLEPNSGISEILVDEIGRISVPSIYSPPAGLPWGKDAWRLQVGDVRDVGVAVPVYPTGAVVIDERTGRVTAE